MKRTIPGLGNLDIPPRNNISVLYLSQLHSRSLIPRCQGESNPSGVCVGPPVSRSTLVFTLPPSYRRFWDVQQVSLGTHFNALGGFTLWLGQILLYPSSNDHSFMGMTDCEEKFVFPRGHARQIWGSHGCKDSDVLGCNHTHVSFHGVTAQNMSQKRTLQNKEVYDLLLCSILTWSIKCTCSMHWGKINTVFFQSLSSLDLMQGAIISLSIRLHGVVVDWKKGLLPKRRKPFGRPKDRCEDSVKRDIKDCSVEGFVIRMCSSRFLDQCRYWGVVSRTWLVCLLVVCRSEYVNLECCSTTGSRK